MSMKNWNGPIVRAPCGHDLAVTPARQMGFVGLWCGHKDVIGRYTSEGVTPIRPEIAHACDCRR